MPVMPEFPEDEFPEPPGWAGYGRESLRRHAMVELLPAIQDAVFFAWRKELPSAAVIRCCQHVQIAARAAIRQLSISPNLTSVLVPSPRTWDIPDYWVPAEATGQELLLPVQLRAYRWAAAVIGRAVQNKLKVMQAKYPTDAEARNLAVRNAALRVCIQDPLTGYLLGRRLAWLVVVSQRPFAPGFRIPPAAGM
jgi:hypothetical protein